MFKNKIYFVMMAMIALLFVVSCDKDSTGPDSEYMDVSPSEALELINNNPNLLIIDVSPAWADGHLPGALSFPVGDGSFEAAIPSWEMDDKYLIYCHGDAPAITASEMLVDAGFENVYRLEGNYGTWVDAGYDIEFPSYMDIMPADALDLINDNPGLIVIDVSNMWEFGHLPGALDYPLGDGSFEAAIPSWDANAMYLVYCHTDAASMSAAQMLFDAGFSNVYRLEGNYGAWVNAGYDIEVENYLDVMPADALVLMNDNPNLITIDVSNMWEFGHLPGALDYPLGDGSFEAAIPSWDANAMYLVYCHTDAASMSAAQMLIDADFIHVYRLEGNYGAWVDAGYDIEVEIYMDVMPAAALDLMDNNPDLLVIDVSPAWGDGHLPGALNFQWGNGDFEAAVPGWDSDAMYLIYCHGDAPSIAAAQHLIDEGFNNVYRLEGNYSAWVDAGYEIEYPSYMDISPMVALELMNNNPDLLVIDVSPAWGDGHLPGALNFQWGNGDFEAAVPGWDSDAMYLIYCHGDAPAIAASQHLIDEGFYNVYRLEGNYSAWVDAGYPIETGPGE